MKQFLQVLKFELNNYFKNKSFLLTTALLDSFGRRAYRSACPVHGWEKFGRKRRNGCKRVCDF